MAFNTQNMPALARATNGQMPQQMVQALMQVLGNCAQPLSHRGPINLQPSLPSPGRGGVYPPGPWDPGTIPGLIPDPGSIRGGPGGGAVIDIPGFGGNDWHSRIYLGDQFSFPISQEFNTFSTYGGPTNYFGGNTYIDNSSHDNITTNNIDARTINNFPAPGTPGTIGTAGPAGSPGAAGLSGSSGFNGLGGLNGGDGRDGAPGPAGSPGGVGPAGPSGASPAVPPGGVSPFWPPPIAGPPGRDGRAGRDGKDAQDPRFPPPDPRAPIAGYVEIPHFELGDDCTLKPSGKGSIVDVRWI